MKMQHQKAVEWLKPVVDPSPWHLFLTFDLHLGSGLQPLDHILAIGPASWQLVSFLSLASTLACILALAPDPGLLDTFFGWCYLKLSALCLLSRRLIRSGCLHSSSCSHRHP
ncbi:uncharacterized protein GJ701_016456 isoform 1-T1 [Geothlypis trichas]